jgi:hypothetical protein
MSRKAVSCFKDLESLKAAEGNYQRKGLEYENFVGISDVHVRKSCLRLCGAKSHPHRGGGGTPKELDPLTRRELRALIDTTVDTETWLNTYLRVLEGRINRNVGNLDSSVHIKEKGDRDLLASLASKAALLTATHGRAPQLRDLFVRLTALALAGRTAPGQEHRIASADVELLKQRLPFLIRAWVHHWVDIFWDLDRGMSWRLRAFVWFP